MPRQMQMQMQMQRDEEVVVNVMARRFFTEPCHVGPSGDGMMDHALPCVALPSPEPRRHLSSLPRGISPQPKEKGVGGSRARRQKRVR